MARVLVIQLSRLGDVIQTTPLLQDWHKSRPGDAIDLLIREENRSALQGFAGLNRVIGLGDGNACRQAGAALAAAQKEGRTPPAAALELLAGLDLPRYRTVINLTYDLLASWLAGRIQSDRLLGGFVNPEGEWMFAGAAQVYLAALLDFRDLNWFNLVDLWRAAAPAGDIPAPLAPPFVATAADLPFSLPAGKKVALNPGSSSTARRWPPVSFARLAEELLALGFVPILVGAPADREACAAVQEECGVRLENFCGRTSVPEMARLLAESCLLVSVDTGALHIAAAVGTPLVGLYGARACFRETAPWSAGQLILQAPLHTDIAGLPPDLVLGACLNRLGMLEESQLQQQLAGLQATAWETRFLAPGADPLGGLGYRAVHRHHPGAGDVFLQALRHVFAGEFRGQESGIVFGDEEGGAVAAGTDQNELGDLLDAVVEVAALFDGMAATAAQAVQLCRGAGPAAATRLHSIVRTLLEAFAAVKSFSDQTCGARMNPVVRYLDWDFRMLPMLPPAETFRLYQKRYLWAAAALRQAALATGNFFAVRP